MWDSISTCLKLHMKKRIKEGMRILANKVACRFTDGKGAFEMCHAFHYFFSLVHISKFLKANFLSTNLCAVYASPEKLVEPLCKADTIEKIRYQRF